MAQEPVVSPARRVTVHTVETIHKGAHTGLDQIEKGAKTMDYHKACVGESHDSDE